MAIVRAGASFTGTDVVDNYRFRPPYPQALYGKLVEIAPAHGALLDIGCGPGKISRQLAGSFGSVVAVDPSAHMIALGRSMPGGDAANIEWVEDFAEDFPIEGRRFDLTVAAASIHWMDDVRLFPRLAAHGQPGHIVAVVGGDDAFDPPWGADWLDFLGKWVPAISGEIFDPPGKALEWERYRNYLDIVGEAYFVSEPFEQSVGDFIRCQQSRDTFAPSKLGVQRQAFEDDLESLLAPHATDRTLRYRVRTKLVWGAIKSV